MANSDTKEFLFRWQLIHEDAFKKLQSLDTAINDVQNWEKRSFELQDWLIYMDKYLSTRLDQDIFSDDVPEDFLRIQEEFYQNEQLLKDLEDCVERYRFQGKLDAAARLDQQITLLRSSWSDLNSKFKKFQKPADFDQKFVKVRKQLDEIEQALYTIDVNTDDSDTIHLQLEHCMKFYKTLSELKSQIEVVLKQGRSIVDKKQVDNTEELTSQLDNLKQKYNDLGSRVTNGKNDLEKAFKTAKKFRKEYSIINDFLGKIDGELRKIEQKPLSKNYQDELEWIKNTKLEIQKVESINLETMRQMRKTLEDLFKTTTLNASSSSTSFTKQSQSNNKFANSSSKIFDTEQKISNLQQRIDDRAQFLNDQARRLDESYDSFLSGVKQVIIQIESLQQQLIDAERNECRETYNKIERDVNSLLPEVELLRQQGSDLCSKSEQYSKVVETEMRSIIASIEDINRRLNLAQERSLSQPMQENITTTVTTTNKQSHHAQESRYTRSRHQKSPSESSIDSTVDVFDSELRQKYMRAVAYLRILDEAPLIENEEHDEYSTRTNEWNSNERHSSKRTDAIDIDLVIEQAKNIAILNEKSNPDRARRILEKVQKLEVINYFFIYYLN